MKSYKVSNELKPYIRRILTRSFHTFKFEKSGDQWICRTPISSNSFHKIVQRAACEKKSKETGLFYVTPEERENSLLYTALMDSANQTTSVLLYEK